MRTVSIMPPKSSACETWKGGTRGSGVTFFIGATMQYSCRCCRSVPVPTGVLRCAGARRRAAFFGRGSCQRAPLHVFYVASRTYRCVKARSPCRSMRYFRQFSCRLGSVEHLVSLHLVKHTPSRIVLCCSQDFPSRARGLPRRRCGFRGPVGCEVHPSCGEKNKTQNVARCAR